MGRFLPATLKSISSLTRGHGSTAFRSSVINRTAEDVASFRGAARGMAQLCGNGIVGIRREDKNKWERRVPLAPQHVKHLVDHGIKVVVQPSGRRVFSDEAYEKVGAHVQEDLSDCGTILAVKQVPIPLLMPDRTYMFFAHVIKAQPANMELLDAMLQKNVRMIDHETIVQVNRDGEKGNRLVAFGEYAGIAGMLDYLAGLGPRMLSLGYSTPFLHLSQTYRYPNLEAAYKAVQTVGHTIRENGLPRDMAPLTFVFTGTGRVASGALKLFKNLPHRMVSVKELQDIASGRVVSDRNLVYGCVASSEDYVRLKPELNPSNSPFDKQHYYSHPEMYESTFHENIAPYTSVLVNCMYWGAQCPRLLTRDQASEFCFTPGSSSRHARLLGVADISCDIEGGIEFTTHSSTIDEPFWVYDPKTKEVTNDIDRPGMFMLSIDHLPAECAYEASVDFGDNLLPFVKELARCPGDMPFSRQPLQPELRAATITCHNQLTPDYEYIHKLREMHTREATAKEIAAPVSAAEESEYSVSITLSGHLFDTGAINTALDLIEGTECKFEIVGVEVGNRSFIPTTCTIKVYGKKEIVDAVVTKVYQVTQEQSKNPRAASNVPRIIIPSTTPQKHVLVLGAGMVSGPLISTLLRSPSNRVTVASMSTAEAERAARGHPFATPLQLDVSDHDALSKQIAAHDLTISFVPAPLHPKIAELCIENRRDMLTASYVSPEMKALHEKAVRAGVTIMNECGVDPGIDHMSALKVIHEVKHAGGRIDKFLSSCGGLPDAAYADNPLGYKFSWSPLGVLRAAQNPARWLEDGQERNVSGAELLSAAHPIRVNAAYALEYIPNRDSLPYAQAYGIESATTIQRSTLRYEGFCRRLKAFRDLGLLDATPRPEFDPKNNRPLSWKSVVASLVGLNESATVGQLEAAVKARLALSPKEAYEILDTFKWHRLFESDEKVDKKCNVLESFCALLQQQLAYRPGEADVLIMHHEFGVSYPDGKKETRLSSMIYRGDKDESAMAKTVGVPAALVAQLMLDGKYRTRGVVAPFTADIYRPVLRQLEPLGITFTERTIPF
eukprot:TRINITY_DN1172_c0_g1::TRINITY_DN1172_c0_g1_i1::g.17228::m.17228 TRINITY_DN1172_c0_g1::TRINITY_DN1172_c0_g1_i1::g.17228  ORF type:complete len:1067 (-),score=345.77,sp/Q9SMZ4/AASS_ARATH/39.05/0.0,Saccharop_dh/PF03435.13/5.1e-93,AlaDh_PNT_C/PF01262.16/3.1e-27,AlaDh_PNT_C/PF01262.16/63,AlaDh_PNT_N/PF05222.10/1.7e-27,Saccharop_dh_N/PF04455.7/1.6e-09,Shikimate_DH/PF01488.15/6.8e+03,Shikimate_DH/PF01488.15/4.8e+03,Shikimate_DH/PF01488.15/0.015,Semialdhyde_dh/PF01118.19/0.18,NAD_binding_7/PF13241.1/4.7